MVERLLPGSVANGLAYAFRISEFLDIPALVHAAKLLVDRHAMLRATFGEVEGIPVQTVHSHRLFDCHAESAAGWEDDKLAYHLRSEARRPFDLASGPPVRFRVLSRSPSDHVLLISIHHLVADMWSVALLGAELARLYGLVVSGSSESPPVPTAGFEEFLLEELATLESDEGAAHLAFWRDYLKDPPAELHLRADRPGRPPTHRSASHSVTLGTDTTAALRRLASSASAHLHDVVFAAFLTLLHRHTGETDLVVGDILANRSAGSGRTVGCFTTPVPVRADLADNPPFAEVVARVNRTRKDTARHSSYPFPKVADELHLGAGRGDPQPYLQAMFTWDRTTRLIDPRLSLSTTLRAEGGDSLVNGLHVAAIPVDETGMANELTLRAGVMDGQLIVTLQYRAELFEAATAARLLGHLQEILEGAVVDAGCRVGELAMLSGEELSQLEVWAGSVSTERDTGAVGELLEAQAAATPEAVAACFGEERLSFAGLNARANRLARHLITMGIGTGDVVGIWLERSLDMVAAVIAVLKSGGAFLPLDPGLPADRLRFMIADSQTRVVITDSTLAADNDPCAGVDYVCLDLDAEMIDGYDDANLGPTAGGVDLAYVIYTSGSTGRPKGVQVEHHSLINLLRAMATRPGLSASDVVLAVTTLSFDPSLSELLLPLMVGAQLVVADRSTAVDPAALTAELARCGATTMYATPATWQMLIDSGWQGDGRLKALCGGEAMSRRLADQLLARCGSVWNQYGPTETTITATVHQVTAGEGPIPIGTPIDNTRLYILDTHHQLLPVGAIGELFIGGHGVARGYLNRPDSDDRFLPDPFVAIPGARMYRTGDLVRRRPDGEIDFLGRADTQIKLRGHRIEPGEIEAHLAELPQISQAVVTAYEHNPGDTRLAAYLIPTNPATPPDTETLRTHLRSQLPGYMVPTAYIILDAFPTNHNHKIDRTRLPAPNPTPTPTADPPRPGLETTIAHIWQQVLGTDTINRNDNFFDLGGHSLLAVRLFARIEAVTGSRPPLSALFRAPTVAGLAELLQTDGDPPRWTSLVPVQPSGDRQPFFYVAPFLITALSFSELGRHLGPDQPLYVLQPQGMDRADPVHRSVEEMAAHYLQEIKEVQPRGPYRLGGHCAGSLVALEMARQLEEQGEQIDLLVLVDSDPPGGSAFSVAAAWSWAQRMEQFRREGRLRDALGWKLRVSAELVFGRWFGRPDGTRRRVAELRAAHAKAHRAYRPRPVRCGATFVRSSEYAALRSRDRHLGWARLLGGGMNVVVVPGTHAQLSLDPRALAGRLRAEMDDCDAATGADSDLVPAT